jgi:phosphoglycerate kinase
MVDIFTHLSDRTDIFKGKKVFIRIDSDGEGDDKGIDDLSLKQSLPTIQAARERGAHVVLLGSRGSPQGKRDPEFSLHGVSQKLGELLKVDVLLLKEISDVAPYFNNPSIEEGSIALLENLRFLQGETKNDPRFVRDLALLSDVFIQDNFSVCHLPHASVVGLAQQCEYSGLGLAAAKEVQQCSRFFSSSSVGLRGLVVGGAHLSQKAEAIVALAPFVDRLIVGGSVATTFLASQGIQVGRSLCEHSLSTKVMEIMATYARRGSLFYQPVDVMVGQSPQNSELKRESPTLEIPPDLGAFDIGPASGMLFRQVVRNLDSIIWTGPMGVSETEAYAEGTSSFIDALSSSHASVLAVGSSTARDVLKSGQAHKFFHVSRAATACLEFGAKKNLQGLSALKCPF